MRVPRSVKQRELRVSRRYGPCVVLETSPLTSTLELEGEIDLASDADLRRAISGAWTPGVRTIRVHLRAVEFMDSTGINALMRLWRRSSGTTTRVVLVAPSPAVRRMLAICGMLDRLPVVD